VGKKVNGTLIKGWLYADQLRIVAELDRAGALISRFVYGSKANVPDYMVRGGVTYRIVSDHLGSPRVVLNADTGDVVQRLDYDPFGVVRQDSNRGFQPFGFAGGLWDADTGWLRLGARDYDAVAGRWMAKDPIDFQARSTCLYSYVGNNPIDFTDPTGTQLQAALPAAATVAAADGPLPVGDVIAGGILGYAAGQVLWNWIFAKETRQSGKEKADDIPSWAEGKRPMPGESGRDFADRVVKERYPGKTDIKKGPGSEWNKLKKFGDRCKR